MGLGSKYMLKRIKHINAGSFKEFKWSEHMNLDNENNMFKDINILYGRNYSGKTTISRIFRSLELNTKSKH